MNMVLNEEQLATQSAAKKLIQAQSPISALRALRDSATDESPSKKTCGYDAQLWQQMVELGWPGIIVPEQYGGLGLTPGYLAVILEEAGRTLTACPLWSSALFSSYLLIHCTNESLKQSVLPEMANGSTTVTVAMEESARHAPFLIKTKLKEAGGNLELNGSKHFVVNGSIADKIIVSARKQKQLCLVLVDCSQPGVIIETNTMVDAHNSATITFDSVNIKPDQLLTEMDATDLFNQSLDIARLGLAAEMLGTASEAFERTLQYLKDREQFGAIIGSFQALKHRAALIFAELELAKSTVREGFAYADSSPMDANELAKLASIAKAQLCETLHVISSEAIQMHGGIGMTDEHEIGFFLKRARVLEQLLGDDVFHIDRFADLGGY